MNLKPADDYQSLPQSLLRKISMDENEVLHQYPQPAASNEDEESFEKNKNVPPLPLIRFLDLPDSVHELLILFFVIHHAFYLLTYCRFVLFQLA